MCKAYRAFSQAGVLDTALFDRFLFHFWRFMHEYSPDDAALLSVLIQKSFPKCLPQVEDTLVAAKTYLLEFIDVLSLQGVSSYCLATLPQLADFLRFIDDLPPQQTHVRYLI